MWNVASQQPKICDGVDLLPELLDPPHSAQPGMVGPGMSGSVQDRHLGNGNQGGAADAQSPRSRAAPGRHDQRRLAQKGGRIEQLLELVGMSPLSLSASRSPAHQIKV
ncbi:hypothetical protein [Gemmobacter serpentinus]|uniref:hypothetical protein n=1 Tax=Gemmobacter serpentinus TaxID=2652247 RepID=UPI00124D70A4|nr:hypothetical protein [Gemmobacter serpentinus]